MKKTIFALIFMMVFALPVTANAAPASRFNDIKPGAWYYEAVDYAASEGLFNGTTATTFSPEGKMTRGMFVTVLGRRAGVSGAKPAATSFSDVAPSDWCAPYVEWAVKNKIAGGIGNGRFNPDGKITREQMAVILYGYARSIGCGDILNGTEILRFPDTGDVADWAKEAMTWAVDKEVLNGSGGRLDPQGTATRAQVAQIFYNCRELFANTEIKTPGKTWVVDVPGHYETVTTTKLVPVTVGEVGHWEDEYTRMPVYRCNQCGYVAKTVEEIEQHIADSINWDNLLLGSAFAGCSNYTQVASDPIYTGNKMWVIDVDGHTELQLQTVTEQVWVEEVGHWE